MWWKITSATKVVYCNICFLNLIFSNVNLLMFSLNGLNCKIISSGKWYFKFPAKLFWREIKMGIMDAILNWWKKFVNFIWCFMVVMKCFISDLNFIDFVCLFLFVCLFFEKYFLVVYRCEWKVPHALKVLIYIVASLNPIPVSPLSFCYGLFYGWIFDIT